MRTSGFLYYLKLFNESGDKSMKNKTPQHTAKKTRRKFGGRITHIAGIILCILFLPGFIINTTLLISSLLHPDIPPNFMGYTPLVAESDSMAPFFEENDLVIIRNGKDGAEYGNNTVICFRSGNAYVTHRIVKTDIGEDGNAVYITQGDANNVSDTPSVRSEQILGSYVTRFKGLGGFVLFMQTPLGMVCCVLLPILIIFSLFLLPTKISEVRKKSQRRISRLSISLYRSPATRRSVTYI